MTAESEKFFNRRTVYPKYGGEQLPSMHVADAKHYGDLRAKEAVKEFAEELIAIIEAHQYDINHPLYKEIDEIKHLAKQKGVEI